MDEPEVDPGCDVCHTVVTGGEGYLRLETDHVTYGHVCSWSCAIQLCATKQADRLRSVASEIEELRRKNAQLEDDSDLLDFYRAGVFGRRPN